MSPPCESADESSPEWLVGDVHTRVLSEVEVRQTSSLEHSLDKHIPGPIELSHGLRRHSELRRGHDDGVELGPRKTQAS